MSRRALSTLACAILAAALGVRASAAPSAAQPRLAVVPAPVSVKMHKGVFTVTAATALVVQEGDIGARRAAAEFADLVARTHGIKLRVRTTPAQHAIRLQRLREGAPEAYRIEVKPREVVLGAATDAGFVHATTTLWQMLSRGRGAASLPAATIDDAPRFAWRGVMLDSARHFQPPEFIRRFIDWMALHKLNVLHWHLTDDQAWRLEIRKYPRLAQVGGWRVPAGAAAAADIDPATGAPRQLGGFYSQDTVRALVAYAETRGVTIVPEIEMPGHASAAIVAYPWLAASAHPPHRVPADWGVYANAYNLDDATFAFLEDVLREVMALFPSAWIHVGGDEVEKAQWRTWPGAQARMRELGTDDPARLQEYFTQRIGRFLAANGRRLVGWDEILAPGLPQGAVVMSWRGIEGALAAAARGHDTVLAAHPTLYFDNRQSASAGEPPGRLRVVSLRDVYEFEPMPGALAPEQRRHVLGLQGNVWTEHIRTEERVARMTFPRAAAVAELGWSAPERRGWEDFRRRMEVLAPKFERVGLKGYAVSSDETRAPARRQDAPRSVPSHAMALCSEHIALALEDDAPLQGPRAVFAVDIRNPCWIVRGVRMDRVGAIAARVGQVPFNFQIGEEAKKIRFPQPQTAEGELEVRLGCEGELVARLPLAPAARNYAVTRLPDAPIAARSGRHDLCVRFAQHGLDPLWVIDSLELTALSR